LFEALELDRRLRLGLEALAFAEPTPVQQQVVPAALTGANLKISAETGSGKTLAYLLPLAQRILPTADAAAPGVLALVLVPTRELARQVVKQARQLLAKSPLQVHALTGGADFKYQRSLLRRNPEIVVATPGRLLEHCQRGSADLSSLQVLVLDEADRMLDMGFRDDVLGIGDFCPPDRQVLMLSATLKHRGLGKITDPLMGEHRTISIGQVREPHSSIRHQVILADGQAHKDRLLSALLRQVTWRRALVFANRRGTAERLAQSLAQDGLRCGCLHGELSTEERKRVMTQFSDGKVGILCASDVAARGLDVAGIDIVVNYDMPRSGDDYLHRTGRAGRAGATGVAVSLVGAAEWNLMISIQRYLKLEFERLALPGLKARYAGPKRTKGSGKAVGSKKKRTGSRATGEKKRPEQRKKRGKPRQAAASSEDGFGPLTRRGSDDR
jgi:superfamily II DNA/RNA helicase